MNKKIIPQALKLSIGVCSILISVWFLVSTNYSQYRLQDFFIFSKVTITFILLLIFGILFSIKTIRNMKRQESGIKDVSNDTLGVTTKITGILAGVGLFLLLLFFVVLTIILFSFKSHLNIN